MLISNPQAAQLGKLEVALLLRILEKHFYNRARPSGELLEEYMRVGARKLTGAKKTTLERGDSYHTILEELEKRACAVSGFLEMLYAFIGPLNNGTRRNESMTDEESLARYLEMYNAMNAKARQFRDVHHIYSLSVLYFSSAQNLSEIISKLIDKKKEKHKFKLTYLDAYRDQVNLTITIIKHKLNYFLKMQASDVLSFLKLSYGDAVAFTLKPLDKESFDRIVQSNYMATKEDRDAKVTINNLVCYKEFKAIVGCWEKAYQPALTSASFVLGHLVNAMVSGAVFCQSYYVYYHETLVNVYDAEESEEKFVCASLYDLFDLLMCAEIYLSYLKHYKQDVEIGVYKDMIFTLDICYALITDIREKYSQYLSKEGEFSHHTMLASQDVKVEFTLQHMLTIIDSFNLTEQIEKLRSKVYAFELEEQRNYKRNIAELTTDDSSSKKKAAPVRQKNKCKSRKATHKKNRRKQNQMTRAKIATTHRKKEPRETAEMNAYRAMLRSALQFLRKRRYVDANAAFDELLKLMTTQGDTDPFHHAQVFFGRAAAKRVEAEAVNAHMQNITEDYKQSVIMENTSRFIQNKLVTPWGRTPNESKYTIEKIFKCYEQSLQFCRFALTKLERDYKLEATEDTYQEEKGIIRDAIEELKQSVEHFKNEIESYIEGQERARNAALKRLRDTGRKSRAISSNAKDTRIFLTKQFSRIVNVDRGCCDLHTRICAVDNEKPVSTTIKFLGKPKVVGRKPKTTCNEDDMPIARSGLS